jgi:hypothetical protein
MVFEKLKFTNTNIQQVMYLKYLNGIGFLIV